MITRPLDLQTKLAAPPRDFDFFFWINVGAICLFFALLGSRFVLAPGVPVGAANSIELPRTAGVVPVAAQVVVSYRRDNMILFEGGIYELAGFKSVVERYARDHRGATMIILADGQVSVQGFLELYEIVRGAGFANVVLGAREPEQSAAPFTSVTR